MTIQIEVTDELLQKYKLSEATQVEEIFRLGMQQVQIEEALLLYKRGLISIWRAATLAGISLREMLLQASARGYEPEVDEETLLEEIA